MDKSQCRFSPPRQIIEGCSWRETPFPLSTSRSDDHQRMLTSSAMGDHHRPASIRSISGNPMTGRRSQIGCRPIGATVKFISGGTMLRYCLWVRSPSGSEGPKRLSRINRWSAPWQMDLAGVLLSQHEDVDAFPVALVLLKALIKGPHRPNTRRRIRCRSLFLIPYPARLHSKGGGKGFYMQWNDVCSAA